MTRYATNTSVSVERSKGEIEKLLQRYGARCFASGWDESRAVIQFEAANGKRIKFVLPLPPQDNFALTPTGRTRRNPRDIARVWEQNCRARWRALALIIKAKLEAVESGVALFESEFGMYVVLPGGLTVGEMIIPQIDETYRTGVMPPLLGMGSS